MRFLLLVIFVLSLSISAFSQDSSLTILNYSSLLPVKEFEDPRINFRHSLDRIPAGDVNGDSIMDFYSIDYAPNETTSDPTDYVYKTSYWYGADSLSLYPDIVVNRAEDPVGDLNGDGIFESISVPDIYSNTGKTVGMLHLSNDETLELYVHNSLALEIRDYAKFKDLDNDGFEDLIGFNYDKRFFTTKEANIHIIWGGEFIDSTHIQTYTLPKADSLHRENDITLRAVDLYADGTTEIIVRGFADNANYLNVYRFDAERNLQLVQETAISLPISNKNTPVTFEYSQADSTLLFSSSNGIAASLSLSNDKITPINEESLTIRNYNSTFVPIGDFDRNGVRDYLEVSSNNIQSIVELDENNNIQNSLSFDAFWLPIVNDNALYLYEPIDLNKDGFNDVLFSINSYDQRLIYVAFGNTHRSLDSLQKIDATFYNNDRWVTSTSMNAGDINNDGMDDLLTVESNYYKETTLNIYFGGSGFVSNPDLYIMLDDTVSVVGTPVLGDFDGDTKQEVLITYSTSSSLIQNYIDKVVLAIVQLDDIQQPIVDRILTSEIISEINPEFVSPEKYQLGNLGDLNADGADDFAISVDFRQQYDSTYLYLGGENMFSKSPIVIDFQSKEIIGLGDINNNGSLNFALSNTNVLDQTVAFNANGQVNIYEFNTATNTLSDSVTTLGNLFYNSENTDYQITDKFGHSMTTGDFNGDGFPDLAVLPEIHYDFTFNEPKDAIYMYYGGADFDASFDYSFPILQAHRQLITQDIGSASYSGDRYLSTLPDINGDGADELINLSYPIASQTHPLIFKGVSDGIIDYSHPIIIKSPNPDLALGSPYPAVGFFTQNDSKQLLMNQMHDVNQLSDPVYLYELPFDVEVSNESVSTSKSSGFQLNQNYPNPFNPSTNIRFSLPITSLVILNIYDILGRNVAVVANGRFDAGTHSVKFDGSNLASGVYIYTLTIGEKSLTKKMLLIK